MIIRGRFCIRYHHANAVCGLLENSIDVKSLIVVE